MRKLPLIKIDGKTVSTIIELKTHIKNGGINSLHLLTSYKFRKVLIKVLKWNQPKDMFWQCHAPYWKWWLRYLYNKTLHNSFCGNSLHLFSNDFPKEDSLFPHSLTSQTSRLGSKSYAFISKGLKSLSCWRKASVRTNNSIISLQKKEETVPTSSSFQLGLRLFINQNFLSLS